ncbi:hypothetical protein CIK05_03090 [Bdellovibrio sp. qaytius]|nr:hypothetical protein CIK05_03090 [Bdellovibrio sp. qaytius]
MVLLFFVFTLTAQIAVAAAPTYSAGPGDKKKDDKKDAVGTTPTYAVTGYARLTSNFIDRGLSYSNGGFAMNASFLVNLGSQLRFGFWGSNISKLGNDDDNLWLKYVAEVVVDFQTNSKFVFYVHDDHFYKTQSLNGIRYGFKLDYGRFTGLLEWQNNYEGTGSSAYYTRVKFNKKYSEKTGLELGAGYTMEYSQRYHNYIDVLGTGYYNAFPNGRLEAGMTLPSNMSQFGNRSRLGYFVGMSLTY